MKMPMTPKPIHELLKAKGKDVFRFLASHPVPPAPDRAYLHWDRLRHRPSPKDLDHESWWLALKMARSTQYKATPLTDVAGKPFVFVMTDSIVAALHVIDSKASGRIAMTEQVTNPETRERFVVNSLIEEAVTSSQLEGASTTRQAAADMIRSGRRPKDISERMIFNNYHAMEHIREIKNRNLTLDLVLELHKTLTEDTLDDPDSAGRIQTPDEKRVDVVDNATGEVRHQPPAAELLAQRMAQMLEFANSDDDSRAFIHPVIRAIVLHFWLAYDHPFVDGNGRVARALFYWAMLHREYWLFEYLSVSRLINAAPARYARAFLYTETDDNDLTYFIIHQVEIIQRAIQDLEIYLKQKTNEIQRVTRMLKEQTSLNHRQLALLAHAIRHPDAEYTVRSHRTSHNVAYATARADLFELAELDLLIRSMRGERAYVFYAPGDLEERLKKFGS